IYLNDDFAGGETRFIQGDSHVDVKPKRGSALLFNHDTLHEGKEVLSGTKYLLRTEVMFRRTDTSYLTNKEDYLDSPNYLKLVSVYQQSFDHSENGDVDKFVDTYLKAIEIQRSEQATINKKERQAIFEEQDLPYELYIQIFTYLEHPHEVT